MILGFIPVELVQAIAGASMAFLINNILGMYNASQWQKFDKQAAIDGLARNALLIGAIVLLCGVPLVLPGELIGDLNLVPLMIQAVEALALARLAKAIAQIVNIMEAKKQMIERDEDILNTIDLLEEVKLEVLNNVDE